MREGKRMSQRERERQGVCARMFMCACMYVCVWSRRERDGLCTGQRE